MRDIATSRTSATNRARSTRTAMTLAAFAQKALLGPLPDPIPRQGYQRWIAILDEQWNRDSAFGILRLLRLLLLALSIVFPTVHLDSLANRFISACGTNHDRVDARIVAVYRESYYLASGAFLFLTLRPGWYATKWAPIVAAYIIADIMHAVLGGVLAWGRYSIDPTRSLVLALFNYAEITAAFAILYLNCQCLLVACRCVSHVSVREALYFSLVTAATVGYGDIVPSRVGYSLVITQIAVFVLFVLFVVVIFMSRLTQETRSRS